MVAEVVVGLDGSPIEVERIVLDAAGIEPGETLTDETLTRLERAAQDYSCAEIQRRRAGGSPH